MDTKRISAPIITLIFSALFINGCYPSIDWGWIEYNHNIVVSHGSYSQETRVTGTVSFNSSNVDLVDTGYMYRGSGTCTVSISGTADDCTIDGSATNSVQLKGAEFNKQITFTFDEQWYQSGSLIYTCPDGSQTIPLLPDTVSFQLTFPAEDGYTIEQPFLGQGGSGTYSWTLHVDTWAKMYNDIVASFFQKTCIKANYTG